MTQFGWGWMSSKGLSATLYDRTTGTNIGNLTSNGGLAAAFDGNLAQTNSTAAIRPNAGPSGGYVGKTMTSSFPIHHIEWRSTTNIGLTNTGNVTIYLYAKNGTPANSTDGTLLGTLAVGSSGANSTWYTVTSSDQSTSYSNVWGFATSPNAGADIYCAELAIYVMA